MKPGIILCIGSKAERERIASWLIANGATPNLIPISSRIIVTGTRLIVDEVIRDQQRRGGKKVRRQKDCWYPQTRKRTFRLRIDLKDI